MEMPYKMHIHVSNFANFPNNWNQASGHVSVKSKHCPTRNPELIFMLLYDG